MIDTEPVKTEQIIYNKWFDDTVAQLRSDELQLTTNTCDLEKKHIYDAMISKNDNETFKLLKDTSNRHFITKILKEYYQLIKEKEIKPLSISLNVGNNGLLVWAVVKENDFETENSLFLAEAQINAKYFEFGFNIDTMTVEDCDNIPTPQQYKLFL